MSIVIVIIYEKSWLFLTMPTSESSEIDKTNIVTPTVTAWPKKTVGCEKSLTISLKMMSRIHFCYNISQLQVVQPKIHYFYFKMNFSCEIWYYKKVGKIDWIKMQSMRLRWEPIFEV